MAVDEYEARVQAISDMIRGRLTPLIGAVTVPSTPELQERLKAVVNDLLKGCVPCLVVNEVYTDPLVPDRVSLTFRIVPPDYMP